MPIVASYEKQIVNNNHDMITYRNRSIVQAFTMNSMKSWSGFDGTQRCSSPIYFKIQYYSDEWLTANVWT